MARLILIALFLTTQAFSQEEPQAVTQEKILYRGLPLDECQNLPEGFNIPARIETCKGVFLTIDFLYWHAQQEMMDLAQNLSTQQFIGLDLVSDKFAFQPFEYKPGFKIGLGFEIPHDDWVFFAEYTRFHSKIFAPNPVVQVSDLLFPSTWSMDSWFSQGGLTNVTAFTSDWQMNLDLIDATLSRPYYQGRYLQIVPFGGLRGGMIRQFLNVAVLQQRVSASNTRFPITSRNQSSAWMIGPRFGIEGNWVVVSDFELVATTALSSLYTRYTKIIHTEDPLTPKNFGQMASYKNYSTLRPVLEGSLGFCWGTYFCSNKYHIDLAASYDFNYFWSQNMMRTLVDDVNINIGPSPGSLSIHGLTLTGHFDF